MATFLRQQLDNMADEWHLNTVEKTHLPKMRQHPVVPPVRPDTFSSKTNQDLARQKPGSAYSREQSAKAQKVVTERYVLPFFTSSRWSRVRTSDTDSSADCNNSR